VRKPKQKGTGYKYVDSPSIRIVPRETAISAMRQAKLANDRYKFHSVFVREMISLHRQATCELDSEIDFNLTNADRLIVLRRQAYLSVSVQTISGFMARLLWNSPPTDEFLQRAKERIANLRFDGRAYVIAACYVLDKLTAPEKA
jgi:hypothetical protein